MTGCGLNTRRSMVCYDPLHFGSWTSRLEPPSSIDRHMHPLIDLAMILSDVGVRVLPSHFQAATSLRLDSILPRCIDPLPDVVRFAIHGSTLASIRPSRALRACASSDVWGAWRHSSEQDCYKHAVAPDPVLENTHITIVLYFGSEDHSLLLLQVSGDGDLAFISGSTPPSSCYPSSACFRPRFRYTILSRSQHYPFCWLFDVPLGSFEAQRDTTPFCTQWGKQSLWPSPSLCPSLGPRPLSSLDRWT
jgi:hypothetical protein